MKNYLLLLFAFLLLAGCDQKRENQNNQLKKVEKECDSVLEEVKKFGPNLNSRPVTIDVVLLKKIPDPLPKGDNIVNYIQLVEGNSGSVIGNPKDYTVIVFAGQTVAWKGKKLPGVSGQKPRIDAIKKKSGKDVLEPGSGTRIDSTDQNMEKGNDIRYRVKGKGELQNGAEEHYNIEISINGTTYKIDPVLKLHDN